MVKKFYKELLEKSKISVVNVFYTYLEDDIYKVDSIMLDLKYKYNYNIKKLQNVVDRYDNFKFFNETKEGRLFYKDVKFILNTSNISNNINKNNYAVAIMSIDLGLKVFKVDAINEYDALITAFLQCGDKDIIDHHTKDNFPKTIYEFKRCYYDYQFAIV